MSSDRKTVKLISFLAFAVAVMQLVLVGVALFAHSGAWTAADYVNVVSNAVSSALLIAGCAFGIRGANRPSAIDPLPAICLAGMVFGAIWTVTGALGYGGLGTNNLSCIISGIVEIAFFFSWRSVANRVIDARDNRI